MSAGDILNNIHGVFVQVNIILLMQKSMISGVAYTKKVCSGNITSTNSAWKYANDLYDMPVRTVRIPHIKNALLNGTFVDRRGITHHTTYHIQLTLKKIFNQMFDYAVEYEMTDKNYARMFNLPEPSAEEKATEKYPHFSFSDRELEIL